MSDLGGVISSKDVWIGGVAGVQEMRIQEVRPANSFSHSGVPGSVQTLIGTAAYNWSASGVGNDAGLFPVTTAASKQFTMSNETGAKLSFSGSILVGSITYTFDLAEKQNPITWQASGMFTGARTSAATGSADTTYAVSSAADLDVLMDGNSLADGTYSTCIQSVSFTFARALAPYVCGGTTYVLPGNLTGAMTLNLLDSDVAGVGFSEAAHQMEVTADSDTWVINYIRWHSIDGPGGNRNNIAPMTVAVTGTFDGEGGGVESPSTLYYGTV